MYVYISQIKLEVLEERRKSLRMKASQASHDYSTSALDFNVDEDEDDEGDDDEEKIDADDDEGESNDVSGIFPGNCICMYMYKYI
jgi:hypothetical protein